ncbi:protocatechuate 3,4-dioxygenase subunit alpha [Undibacterium terreum]|uniref:Protocatechuate 3,4-dioxygenase subunit alpha n=1 Tax=Undibacterium terreum TaxID=1224302 RepID=A0A916UT17_9BURK|nr:protocatechuate 3,4-dioxygenase subunit alpha [Undibacterium terreum]GGC86981.1 protocatechuate 3,4-dioxygenase subunit alpha [Undibacterium terreum]
MTLKQTPSQTVGPYFAYGLTPQQYNYDMLSIFDAVIADHSAKGEHIQIVGQVLDGAGKPVADAMLEFLQADADGKHIASTDDIIHTGFTGYARIGTGSDVQQRYVLQTVKPGRTAPGQAPHVNVIVFMRGLLVHAYTRLYFDDEATANSEDDILNSVPADRRHTLIAKREQQAGGVVYRFDIHMQGQDETVFFDV